MGTVRLEDVALLRANPALDIDHQASPGTSKAVRLFVGNATANVRFPAREYFVRACALDNSILLEEGSIVVRNQPRDGKYALFRVLCSDLPAVLGPQFTKIIPRSSRICAEYLSMVVNATLKGLAQVHQFHTQKPPPLELRRLRGLPLSWPDRTTQRALLKARENRVTRIDDLKHALDDFDMQIYALANPSNTATLVENTAVATSPATHSGTATAIVERMLVSPSPAASSAVFPTAAEMFNEPRVHTRRLKG